MTTKQALPITAMLKEILYKNIDESDKLAQLSYIVPQVRTLEEAQRKKAKEKEKQRIVGILEEMKFCIQTINEAQKIPKEKEPYDYAIQILQEAITRITN